MEDGALHGHEVVSMHIAYMLWTLLLSSTTIMAAGLTMTAFSNIGMLRAKESVQLIALNCAVIATS